MTTWQYKTSTVRPFNSHRSAHFSPVPSRPSPTLQRPRELGWRTLFVDAFLEDTLPRLVAARGPASASAPSPQPVGPKPRDVQKSTPSQANVINTTPSVQKNRPHRQSCIVPSRAARRVGMECLRRRQHKHHGRRGSPLARSSMRWITGSTRRYGAVSNTVYSYSGTTVANPAPVAHRSSPHRPSPATSPRPHCCRIPSGRAATGERHVSLHRIQRIATAITRSSMATLNESASTPFWPTAPSTIQRRSDGQSLRSREYHIVVVRRLRQLQRAFIADLRHDLSHHFQLRANLHLSPKNLDDGSAWNTSVSSNTPAFVGSSVIAACISTCGPAATDVRQIVAINGTYVLPVGRGETYFSNSVGVVSHLISGWSLSTIANLPTGLSRFSPQLGYTPTGSGDSRNPVRPNLNPNFSVPLYAKGPTTKKVTQYFNPAAFSAPAYGTVGNVSRDSLTGPGFANWDFSLLKSTQLTERTRLPVPRRILQHFQPHQSSASQRGRFYSTGPTQGTTANQTTAAALGSPGVISATANTSRQIQLAVKIVF